MVFPVLNVTQAASRALYPVLSRQQNAPEIMARLYLRTVSLIALVTAPLMVGLLVVREPFVRVVFGPGWPMVPEILAWLAPTGFIQSIVSSTGTVFMARNRTNVMAGLGTFNAILTVSAFALGAQFGVIGVAAFYFAANVLHAIPCLFFAMRTLESSPKLLLKAIAVPVASALLMGLGVAVLRELFSPLHMGDFTSLAMSVVAGGLMYGLLVVMVFRQDLADLRMFMSPAH
jgi:PST family polysaccharide transporter